MTGNVEFGERAGGGVKEKEKEEKEKGRRRKKSPKDRSLEG